ncbi:uncharacterized protein LOC129907445 [Episyrphus balteatus]|uniref:uncharacterized protein LOC129907445 n=1 Tax=Episyrphus balteatus TaxID=286459 RepID=UPI002486CC01|nr:uncharacterized protein LOC129907445 [Episyrphus balteatus]XP_055839662.1 uncharacterized protein LOC129907445 [Episyrphus balteatus]
MFTNKNSIMSACWKAIAEKMESTKDANQCKQQWKNLLNRYKACLAKNTGEGAGDDAPDELFEKKEWPYFDLIHQYASKKDNYFPMLTLDSHDGAALPQLVVQQESNSPVSPSSTSTSPFQLNIRSTLIDAHILPLHRRTVVPFFVFADKIHLHGHFWTKSHEIWYTE